MGDITGANAILMISIPGLLPVPTQLQGFAVDDVYETDEVTAGEFMMGVDGGFSGGMVFEPTPQTISFLADSPSVQIFEAWDAFQQANQQILFAQMNATFPSMGRSYQQFQGGLSKLKRLPDVKKLAQTRRFRLIWRSIFAIPVGIAG